MNLQSCEKQNPLVKKIFDKASASLHTVFLMKDFRIQIESEVDTVGFATQLLSFYLCRSIQSEDFATCMAIEACKESSL